MILIADSGSTKTDWILLDVNKKELFRTRSLGLNPAILLEKELLKRLNSIEKIIKVKLEITEVYFYGAGCGSPKPIAVLKAILNTVFSNAKVYVKEDMLAAVYACTSKKPAIVCILGTGSNSCYYDGNQVQNIGYSLGYSIMDEASGNYFGKILLRDYFYNRMPELLKNQFTHDYDLDIDVVKNNLYLKPNPNKYLASFSKFMYTHKNDYYIEDLIQKGFEQYFKYQVLPYNKASGTPIYFIGSIAYYFRDILENVAKKNNLNITDVIQHPIDNLVKFHQENTL